MLRLGRDNLFDYVRLYAALQVALKHAYNYIDFPSAGLLAHIFTLSGVPVFFSLSGFLIGLSFLRSFRDRDFVKFFYRRIYRIYPALYVSFFLTFLLILCLSLHSNISVADFAVWTLAQLSIFQYYAPSSINDLSPVGNFNGSLWTIPVELQFYSLALILLVINTRLPPLSSLAIRKLRSCIFLRAMLFLVFSVLLYLSFSIYSGGFDTQIRHLFPGRISQLVFVSIISNSFPFLLGVVCIVPLYLLGAARTSCFLVAVGVLAYCGLVTSDPSSSSSILASSLVCCCFSIGIGLIKINTSFCLPFDLSYGIYIYHMPLINLLLIAKVSGLLSWLVFGLALPILSLSSWFIVERPALLRLRAAG